MVTDFRLLAAEKLRGPLRRWVPRPHQIAPPGDWTYWLLMAGRGAGKTDAGAHYVDTHMNGPACMPGIAGGHRAAIIAPTLDDARETCVRGISGLLAANDRLTFNTNRGVVSWPNGAEARIFGAYQPEDPERLRGPQHCLAWCEEFAAWRQITDTFDMMRFGLRVGSHPRAIFTTTPKPRPAITALMKDAKTATVRATTDDNPHLDAAVRAALYEKYDGTRLGKQELAGELLLDVPGALWTFEDIARGRVRECPPLARVVIAVDPAATSDADADETAIAVAGKGYDGHYYVISVEGYHLSPGGWAAQVCDAYDAFGADLVLAEVNNGGEMVSSTLHAARASLPVKVITASRGKTVRAEPVSLLYEKKPALVHHVGTLEILEDQMSHFPVAVEHDDRVDALVYALTELAGIAPTQDAWSALRGRAGGIA